MARPKSILMNEETTQENTASSREDLLQAQVDMLMKQMQEMQSKDKKSVLSSDKEIYSGPRFYSFRYINIKGKNKPITGIKVVSDKTDQNLNGVGYTVAQAVEVTYADGTTENMLWGDYENAKRRSKKYEPVRVEKQYKLFLKGSNKPIIMAKHEADERYKKIARGQQNPVWNFETLDTERPPMEWDLVTFRVLEQDEDDNYLYNDGEEFTVNPTAIN